MRREALNRARRNNNPAPLIKGAGLLLRLVGI
jgi:hypothetical protein